MKPKTWKEKYEEEMSGVNCCPAHYDEKYIAFIEKTLEDQKQEILSLIKAEWNKSLRNKHKESGDPCIECWHDKGRCDALEDITEEIKKI